MLVFPKPPDREADGILADKLILLLRPENLLPGPDETGNADCFLLVPPNPDGLTDLSDGVAVIVGVESARVIVVALLNIGTLFGLNVGLFLDANGIITGVKDGFFAVKVSRPFFLGLASSSSSSCSVLDSVVVSATELSITSGVGLITDSSVVVVVVVDGFVVVVVDVVVDVML